MTHDLPRLPEFTYDAAVTQDRCVRVVLGPGSLEQAASEAKTLGTRVLLISGRHEEGPAARVSDQVGAACVGHLRDVTEHVPVDVAAGAVSLARETDADVVVTIGGGSATGLAKAIALETGSAILAVPTTYAGSEMTPIWGMTDDRGKTTGRDLAVLPRTVVYDPVLTTSLPAGITAASGMNAIAHALESLYAPDSNALMARVAEEALRTLYTGIPAAVADPDDLEARSNAQYGAWLAGWALGATTMGLHHKLAHVLGGTYRLPHAGVHSALLPQVAAYNGPFATRAFIRAARALGVSDGEQVATALYDLASRISSPTSLAELGMDAGAIEDVAGAVAGGPIANPRPVTEAEIRQLLCDAQAGKRPSGEPTGLGAIPARLGRSIQRRDMTDTPTASSAFETERERIRVSHLRPLGERPPSSARGLHHTALISSDVERTIGFYQDLLEFPLTELIENRDYEGSTHFFFDIGNGNLLAFFDFPGLDVGPYAEVLGGLHHMAISVDPERWDYLVDKLKQAGVEHVVHSGVSVYFRDPDGARIELIADPLGEMYGTKVL